MIVEVDGEHHMTREGRTFDTFLSEQGYHVIRIPGYELIREDGKALELVMEIMRELENRST